MRVRWFLVGLVAGIAAVLTLVLTLPAGWDD